MTESSATPTTATSGLVTADPPADLYREVHKGLRRALFEVVQRAGSLDPCDAEAVSSLRDLFSDLDMMLATHHAHEEGAELAALIARHAGDLVATVTDDHDRLEKQLDGLRTAIAALDRTPRSAAEVFDRLTAFTADYLAHMNVEEQHVMPRLREGATSDELTEITMAIRTSVPPPEMCVFLRSMLPAMNPDERTATLGGMQAGAPPEIFELFWNVAEQHLSPSDLATVADRIGVAALQS